MPSRRWRVLGIMIFMAAASDFSVRPASAADMTPGARRLADLYDHLDVEDHWIAGHHIDWASGDPDGQPEKRSGTHTHCSSFVAAAAARLGIYILRPPEHGQVLLANAQEEWLAGPGRHEGWRRLSDADAAQDEANAGSFVVAVYHNRREQRPGHIAIVRPSLKTADMLAEEGPDVIQAGAHNYTRTSLRTGFAGHPHAFSDAEIEFYAHEVPGESAQKPRS